jgi:hypothetical protein
MATASNRTVNIAKMCGPLRGRIERRNDTTTILCDPSGVDDHRLSMTPVGSQKLESPHPAGHSTPEGVTEHRSYCVSEI